MPGGASITARTIILWSLHAVGLLTLALSAILRDLRASGLWRALLSLILAAVVVLVLGQVARRRRWRGLRLGTAPPFFNAHVCTGLVALAVAAYGFTRSFYVPQASWWAAGVFAGMGLYGALCILLGAGAATDDGLTGPGLSEKED